MRRSHLFATSLALLTLATAAVAQDAPPDAPPGGGNDAPPPQRGPGNREGAPGRGGDRGGPGFRRQLDPEKAKAAWEAQAGYVARMLSLDEGQSATLAMIYTDARETHGAELTKLREQMFQQARESDDPGTDPRAAFEEAQKKMAEFDKTHREKFAGAVSDALGAEKSAKAVAVLGSFDPAWDGMVDAINGFKLEPEKLDKAIAATSSYNLASAKAREFGDREAMRTAMQEARETLNDAMKPLLSEEQMQQFQRAVGGRRGMGGGQGGQGGAAGGEGRRGGGQGGQGGQGGEGGQPGRRGGRGGDGGNEPAPPPPPPPGA